MAKAALKLSQVNLIASDIPASVDFYKRLGVKLPKPVKAANGDYFHVGGASGGIGVDLDSPQFAQVWNAGWKGKRNLAGRVVLSFHCATRGSVDAYHSKLTRAGHKSLVKPFDAFWGARYAIVEDPNGIAVGLMSPVSKGHRSPLPKGWE
jgi:catechol 2,3-dioxygenase-like lactoylglutathione lyase family enzyme